MSGFINNMVAAVQDFDPAILDHWVGLGLGGLLIYLVAFSIFKLITAWSTYASTERTGKALAEVKAKELQDLLSAEMQKTARLEEQVKQLTEKVQELHEQMEVLKMQANMNSSRIEKEHPHG